MPEAKIIKTGSTPRIDGSRITVFDVLDYHKHGWQPSDIADLFNLSTCQIEVAIEYIEAHKTEVMADYQRILDRHAKGNPPELQARLDEGHERFLAMVKARREAKNKEEQDARDSRGHLLDTH
jgi:uncharacterized protein (DUF433 family)